MNKFVTAEQAAEQIKDGDSVVVCGCENILLPDTILAALEKRFIESGHPRDLTEIHPVIHGMGIGLGLEHFAHPGMLKMCIGSGYSYLKTSNISRMLRENELKAYILPMGSLFDVLDGTASGKSKTYTKVGIGTFVDSDVEGGCMSAISPNDFCHHETLDGEDYLVYDNPRVDVAILRGTSADEFGNISLEQEPMNFSVLTLAMAAKACGGKVIVQVKRLVKRGSLKPRDVEIPGIMVDMVVLDENQPASGTDKWNAALTGEIRVPVSAIDPLPLNYQKVISRRAAAEINRPHMIVNLGVGMPTNIPIILNEQGSQLDTIFFPEHGAIGGVPADRSIFGTNINPEVIIDHGNVFKFFRTGGLDMTFLGCGEFDMHGNVNVSKFNGIIPGCGGFIDITYKTPKLFFIGSFTAGGLEIEVADGKLNIIKEGKYRKLIENVEQITLNGQLALERGQEVTFITERAVFKLTPKGVRLAEYAPGIDVQKDILDLIPFEVITDGAVLMDAALFTE